MAWRAGTGKRASALSSFSVFHPRNRRLTAVLVWFEAVEWMCLTQGCVSADRRRHHKFTVASEARLPCDASLPAARTELNKRLLSGDFYSTSEKSVTSGARPPRQHQPLTSTRMTGASGRAEGRKLSAAALKRGAPLAALMVALMSSITTLLYGSPKQAYKRFRLKARLFNLRSGAVQAHCRRSTPKPECVLSTFNPNVKPSADVRVFDDLAAQPTPGKVPWSWGRYWRSLPVIQESDFPDFPKKWPKAGNRLKVMMVREVSPKLAKFLHLGPEEKLHGIAIKATIAGNQRSAQDVLNEINAHMNMVPRSKFIVPALGAYRSANGERVYLILPRLRGNARVMLETQAGTLNVQLALAEMAYSVKVLHDAGFVHRDIKLLNFFVGFDGHVVLGDFEGAFDKTMWLDTEKDLVVYSEGYLAPEIRKDKQWIRFNEKSDIYALGVCFRHFLNRTRDVPRKAHLQRLIDQMTTTDVSKRYTMQQVLNSPYFDGINFEEIELLNQGVPFPGGADAYEDTRRFQ